VEAGGAHGRQLLRRGQLYVSACVCCACVFCVLCVCLMCVQVRMAAACFAAVSCKCPRPRRSKPPAPTSHA
jgi:hypothetical protein